MFDNNRLKQRRLDMGLTLEEVGEVVGISRSAVQKYEKGIIKNIYTSSVELFAKALRCSPAYLMCWTDDPHIDMSSNQKCDIALQYNQLDDGDKIKASGFISGLLAADKYKSCDISSDMVSTVVKGEESVISTHIVTK